MAKRSISEPKLKIYIIKCGDGIRRIEIPDTWKVTFGRMHPGEKCGHYDGQVLRIYESNDKQRAAFTNVISFLDVSINPQKLVQDKKQISKILHKKGITAYKDICDIKELWTQEFVDWETFEEDEWVN